MVTLRVLVPLALTAVAVWPSDTVASIAWTRQFGGSASESISGMARDAAGNIYVAGTTESIDLPANGVFRTPRDSNLFRFDLLRGTAEPLPSALGGVVLAFATTPGNPDLVYASSSGGVMRSLDRGRTWEPLSRQPVLYTITIDPRDPQVLYGGATALMKSTDGGRTWFQSDAGIQVDKPPPGHTRIVPHPRRAGVLFAIVPQATSLEGLLFRSDDAGAHWARQYADLTMQIAFDPQRPGVVFAAGRFKIYKSTDDGDSWAEIATVPEMGLPGPLIVDPVRPRTLYVSNGILSLRSTDDGVSWQQMNTPGGFGFADASGTLYAWQGGTIFISRDGATTWATVKALPADSFALLGDGALLLGTRKLKDAFVAKFSRDGDLVWATYLGGSDDDTAGPIAVDSAGNVYVAGRTASEDFPVTPGTFASDSVPGMPRSFLTKISADGQALAYSMLFTGNSWIGDIAVDSGGDAFFAGWTIAPIPTTAGAVWPDFDYTLEYGPQFTSSPRVQAYAAKLDPGGARLLYATYLRSRDQDTAQTIAVDEQGFAYVGGTALWKLTPDATGLVFSTALGSIIKAMLASDGMLYVMGQISLNRPFVAKFTAEGAAIASTALGNGVLHSISIAPDGTIVLAGSANVLGFPTRGLLETQRGGWMGWVGRLNGALSDLPFGSYGVGGVAVADGNTGIVSVGATGPDTNLDVVLMRTEERDRGSAPRIDAVLNEASMLGGSIASGERVLINGVGFGSSARVWFGDAEGEVLGATEKGLLLRAPALPATGAAALKIVGQTETSQPVDTGVIDYAPAIYTIDGSGRGQALVLHGDGSRNSANNPAPRGSIVTFLINGVDPLSVEDGKVALPNPLQGYIAGQIATTVDAELLPVPGLNGPILQLRVRVPELWDGALPAWPAKTGISLMVKNRWTLDQYPLTMWIK